MAGRQLRTALQHFRGSLYASGEGALSDAHLLERWTVARDEVAFELLLRRHGPMVFALCRRLLNRAQDAEDAFQATFLVLVRRAGSIRKQTALGSWLYKVAYRIALRARHKNELPLVPLNGEAVPDRRDPSSDVEWRDLRPVLDEEVHRLPPRWRAVFVLCQLQGKTNEEAARELGCPLGTVLSRLSRARDRLRHRLTRRGVTISAAALPLLLGQQAAATPPLLLGAAIRHALSTAELGAAAAPIPAAVSSLCQGVLQAMFLTKLKVALSLLLIAGLTGIAGGLVAYHLDAQEPVSPVVELPKQDTKPVTIQELKEIRSLGPPTIRKGPVVPVWSLAFSPDGEQIVWGSADGMVYTWGMADAKLLYHFTEHEKPVTGVAFSTDGKILASAGLDGFIYLCDAASGKIMSKLNQNKPVLALAFSPDGKTLATGGQGGTTYFWSVPSGKQSGKAGFIADDVAGVKWLQFDADGQLLTFVGGKKVVWLWDLEKTKEIQLPQGVVGTALAFSPDGKTLALGDVTGNIHLLTVPGSKTLLHLKGHQKAVAALAFTPDGKVLASAGKDQTVRLWDVQTGKQISQGKQGAEIFSIAISPQGKHLITGGKDGVIKIWDVTTGKQVAPLPGAPEKVIGKGSDSLSKLIKELLQRKKSDADCVEALFLATLGRYPTQTEVQFAAGHLTKHKADRGEALQDVLFMLTNTNEFMQHLSDLQQHIPPTKAVLPKVIEPKDPVPNFTPPPKNVPPMPKPILPQPTKDPLKGFPPVEFQPDPAVAKESINVFALAGEGSIQ